MAFFLAVLFGMLIGRKLGWSISKLMLYPAPFVVMLVAELAWGMLIAFGLRALITWFSPGWILKVFAFGAAAYTSIPNYGLFTESTIPPEVARRHFAVTNVGLAAFVGASVIFAYIFFPSFHS